MVIETNERSIRDTSLRIKSRFNIKSIIVNKCLNNDIVMHF